MIVITDPKALKMIEEHEKMVALFKEISGNDPESDTAPLDFQAQYDIWVLNRAYEKQSIFRAFIQLQMAIFAHWRVVRIPDREVMKGIADLIARIKMPHTGFADRYIELVNALGYSVEVKELSLEEFEKMMKDMED